MAREVRIVVAKRVEVARSAKGLAEMSAYALAHVVDDEDRDRVLALHLAEEAEERGDVGAAVFVEAVESHQGIEQEELRTASREGPRETLLIGREIEPDGGCGDDVDIESREVERAMHADGTDALTDARERVLGEVDEGRAAIIDGEAIEKGRARCDADGHVEPEPALRAFGLSPAEPDGLVSPHVSDEPVRAGLESGQIAGTDDGELAIMMVRVAQGKMAFRAEAM